MKKILLIAGHGKNQNGTYDPGAVSIHGQEADYNRELVVMVQQAIGGAVPVTVYDTEKNCYSFSKAGQAPDYKDYDIVCEFHFNAKAKKDEAGDGGFTGIGAYVHPNNAGGKDIANKIINAVAALGFKKWQLSTSTGLLNLNNAQRAGADYLLLETAFIDDGDDMKWYNDNKARVAQQIAQVLIVEAGGTVPAAKPDVYYRVQVGAFTVKSNAINFLTNVKKHIPDAFIVKNGEHYKVQAGAYSIKENAERHLKELKSLGYADAFITTDAGAVVSVEAPKKSNAEIAREVIRGIWGNGAERKQRLKTAGYDYDKIQEQVNKLL